MIFYSQTLFCLLIVLMGAFCENKYSRTANEKKKSDVDFRSLEKPFRMNKLNLLWTKARQVGHCFIYNFFMISSLHYFAFSFSWPFSNLPESL